MKFQVGQLVVHCHDGLSHIQSLTTIGDREYFVVSREGSEETTYVPTLNAENIIRLVMSEDEAFAAIEMIKNIAYETNANTKQRRDNFKKHLSRGAIEDNCFMYKQLWLYNHQDKENPTIKYGPIDIEMLEYASNNLLLELSHVLKKPIDEINQLIDQKLI